MGRNPAHIAGTDARQEESITQKSLFPTASEEEDVVLDRVGCVVASGGERRLGQHIPRARVEIEHAHITEGIAVFKLRVFPESNYQRPRPPDVEMI